MDKESQKLVPIRMDDEPEGPDQGNYLADVEARWAALLATDPAEDAVHAFIEQHPCLLPDPYRAFKRGHHGMLTGLVYSKPHLPGPRLFIPDFMFVAMDSSGIFPTLIEIEKPGKKHATKAGLPSRDLEHARGQLRDWADWFEVPENQTAFRKQYGITDDVVRVRRLRPRYVLVYGRRDDVLNGPPRFARTRADSVRHDTIEMTYDRLEANLSSATAPVVRMDTSSPTELRFRVVTVPAVADAHAFQFIDQTKVIGLSEALAAQSGISNERKAWLLRKAGSHLKLIDEIRREGDFSDRDDDDYDDDGDDDCESAEAHDE